jgi:copper resistance protein D
MLLMGILPLRWHHDFVIALLTLIRAVHFGSCLVLQSIFAVLFLVAIPAWDQSGGKALPVRERFYRRLHRLLMICLVAALVSGFLWIWVAIAGMSGTSLSEAFQWDLFRMVLGQTQPGHVWMVRTGLLLVLAATLPFFPRGATGSKAASLGLSFGALAGLLLTGSLAWLGHAGAGEGPEQNLQLAGDIVHLVAAGVWPAGLVPLALLLGCSLPAGEPGSRLGACVATRRFSTLSLVAVAVLGLSGVVNSYYLVGTFHALVSTEYGRLLMLKLALFGATIGIGAWNLFLCKSRLPGEAENLAVGKVARNVIIEIVLATLILLVVGWLGISPPAGHS